MIKKTYLPLIGLGLILTSPSFAKAPFGVAGCGLGSIIMGPEGNQVFASTTNGTLANQVFGITSGSSNCLEPSKQAALSAQQKFIAENYTTLSKEMAQGEGEALKAFSNTFGCTSDVYSSFAGQMQRSYSKIFSVPGSMTALEVIQDEIKGSPELAKQCNLVL